jgi:hypothetical protein
MLGNWAILSSAALHVANVHGIAEVVLFSDFDGSIATAMEHESGVLAEETAGVNALAEGVGSESGGFLVVPERLHGGEREWESVAKAGNDEIRMRNAESMTKARMTIEREHGSVA